jgi:hypothetical protein
MKKPFFHAEIPIETVHPPIYPILSAGECPKKNNVPNVGLSLGLPWLTLFVMLDHYPKFWGNGKHLKPKFWSPRF